MTEPIDPVTSSAGPVSDAGADAATAEASVSAAVPAPPWGEYAAAAAVVPAQDGPAGSADRLRGVLAGLVAAVVGATAWAVMVALTHYEIGIAAVAVGWGIGWAVHRFGGVASTGLAVAAAAMAAVGILSGFVLAQLLIGAHDAGVGFLDVVDVVTNSIGWVTFITHSTNGLGWFFLAIGALSAFRLVAQQRRR